jgi:hypothetical protein
MPVSETVVKRTLATFRSRNNETTLQFQSSTLDEDRLARLHSMLEQIPEMQGENGQLVQSLSIQNLTKSLIAYRFGYAERPLYPRHNRKIPKD